MPCIRKARQGHDEPHQQRLRDFWAIKDSWFSIDQDQVFCLLGPNGAGKTTTINCLTGACVGEGFWVGGKGGGRGGRGWGEGNACEAERWLGHR